MFLVALVNTTWNQMWKILLEELYQDDQEYNIIFKQYERHLLHAGEIQLEIRSALEETEVNDVIDGEDYKVRKPY